MLNASAHSTTKIELTNPQPPMLLVVDDDPVISIRLKTYFSGAGYAVLAASNGEDMWRLLNKEQIDLVLLDIGLPGKDGLDLARELRAHDGRLGIILVTGRADDIDKIVGLESGADDYVTKPFNSRELLARVKIVLRGKDGRASIVPVQTICAIGHWHLDMAHRQLVDQDGQEKILTRGEFDLLAALADHPGVTLSRERLMQLVSHRNWDPNDRTIDVLISRLREKLENDPRNPELLATVRGEGYVLRSGSTSN